MNTFGILLLAALSASGSAADFEGSFAETTLRLDYQLCGDKQKQHIFLAGLKASPQWAGRRHRLTELPLEGRGQLTMTSAATGDTIYRTSFCSLFTEWLDTDEAATTPRAFEHTVLAPMPKEPVNVTVTLTNPAREVITTVSHPVDPADILIARPAKEAVTHKYIHKGGDPTKAIDVAILAEGYSHDQLDLFYADAEKAVASIMSHEPFASRSDDFNFVAVATTADLTDVSKPKEGEWVPSTFGSHFSTFYSDRYLTTPRVFAVNDALTGIPYEHIIILANTQEYGGGGIYNDYTLTTSRHDAFWPVVTHEFGHSFGALADEYFHENEVFINEYPLHVEPWEKNVTTLVDFRGKWEELLPGAQPEKGKKRKIRKGAAQPDPRHGVPVPTPLDEEADYPVGLYEGGAYLFKGVYRSTPDCRMKTNTADAFCPACQLALTRLIDFYTR